MDVILKAGMPASIVLLLSAIILLFTGCTQTAGNAPVPAPESTAFTLSSTAFEDGGEIPIRYSCLGDNTSPELHWSGAPEDTEFYILLMEDLDTREVEAHWILYNIPVDVTELHDGISHNGILDTGAIQGRNYQGRLGYYGPCHEELEPHRYRLILYAVDTYIDANSANRTMILERIEGHVLGQTELTGIFKP